MSVANTLQPNLANNLKNLFESLDSNSTGCVSLSALRERWPQSVEEPLKDIDVFSTLRTFATKDDEVSYERLCCSVKIALLEKTLPVLANDVSHQTNNDVVSNYDPFETWSKPDIIMNTSPNSRNVQPEKDVNPIYASPRFTDSPTIKVPIPERKFNVKSQPMSSEVEVFHKSSSSPIKLNNGTDNIKTPEKLMDVTYTPPSFSPPSLQSDYLKENGLVLNNHLSAEKPSSNLSTKCFTDWSKFNKLLTESRQQLADLKTAVLEDDEAVHNTEYTLPLAQENISHLHAFQMDLSNSSSKSNEVENSASNVLKPIRKFDESTKPHLSVRIEQSASQLSTDLQKRLCTMLDHAQKTVNESYRFIRIAKQNLDTSGTVNCNEDEEFHLSRLRKLMNDILQLNKTLAEIVDDKNDISIDEIVNPCRHCGQCINCQYILQHVQYHLDSFTKNMSEKEELIASLQKK